jgi:hypothetical protein
MTVAITRQQASRYASISATLWPTYVIVNRRVEHHAWMILCLGTII